MPLMSMCRAALRHLSPRSFSSFHTVPKMSAPSPVSVTLTTSSTTSSCSSGGGRCSAKAKLRGMVFDMDGTLTVPVIDFPAMYRAVLGEEEYLEVKRKNPSGIDILHHIESWSPDEQRRAYEIIADFEKQGLDRLQIMPENGRWIADVSKQLGDVIPNDVVSAMLMSAPVPVCTVGNIGALELCDFLELKRLRRGLITRNVKAAVDLFHLRFGMTFCPALSREFRPYKPDPAPLLHICTTWEVEPNEVMMIGDSLKDDVACGKRAGAFTCLLDETGRYNSPEYANVEHKPDYKVSSLAEVLKLLDANFDLTP